MSSPSVPAPPRWLFPLLAVLFFGSGACALVYQVMWLRLLSLVFGVTVYAASTVLAGFMAGLAVGSYAAGRLASRVTRPLAAFGVVEALVGLTALGSPVVLTALTGVWISVHAMLPDSLAVTTLVRFVVAFLVLIVPTSLMGATLPLVVKSALARQERVGGRIGLLYAINTSGAIIGALVAGFYFISEIGVAQSFRIAASTNLAIGIVAVLAGYLIPAAPHRAPEPEDLAATEASSGATAAQRQLVLWTFFVSGLMSLALEVVWFRMLVLFLRPTAYAFTIMLATVLLGIALGSALAAPVLRRRTRWLPVLAVIQALTGLAAVLSFNTISSTQKLWEAANPWFTSMGINTYLTPIIVSSVVAMLPTTLLLGMAFPMGLAIWAGDGTGEGTSRRVGAFYSLNVLGAIAGSVLSGFVMLPFLGSRNSLRLMAALAIGSAVAMALAQWRERPRFAAGLAVGAPVLFALAALVSVDPFDVEFERFHQGEKLLWRTEGAQTTVAIHERPRNPVPIRIMYLDGHHQANDSDGTAFVHHRIGALPVMLHPHPTTALVVGLGGGATPGAVARFGIDVDVVELSAAVVAGSDYFTRINFDLLKRPNVHLRVDDGRNFLMMREEVQRHHRRHHPAEACRRRGALLEGILRARARRAGRRRARHAVERRRHRDRIQADGANVPVGVSLHHALG